MMLWLFDRFVRLVYRRQLASIGNTPGNIELRLAPRTTNALNAYCTTLGHTILLNTPDALTPKRAVHELTHVAQWERYGPVGFLARYAWYARLGHDKNPLELEAMKSAGEL